ncbi:LmeA family phospholipid-binding protein [Mycetocola tolaasinivorans]|uniref:LmeA family phospholipid-binding protein n=1 Tax=Mycetocola tolaasinivorans TaxID=76635 RepID=UPI0016023D60|nr:DUF2993 domain-containing protein [Mycetocola tolaasinivorans]
MSDRDQPEVSANQELFERLNAARLEHEAEPPKPKRTGRRWIVGGVLSVVLAGVLGGGVLIANNLVRGVTEDTVKQLAESAGATFQGPVGVKIKGDWPLFQFLSGSFADVEISAQNAVIRGVPLSFDIRAQGVPIDPKRPADAAQMSLVVDQDGLNDFIKAPTPGGALTLGDGVFGYLEKISGPFGIELGAQITASPAVSGTTLTLKPVGAEITSPVGNLNVDPIVKAILGKDPIPVCLADRLPPGAELNALTVTPQNATIVIDVKDIALTGDLLSSRGKC